MASANGLINNNLVVNTLDGLTTVSTSGGIVDPSLYVKYIANTNDTDLSGYNITTSHAPTGTFDLTNKTYVDSSITTATSNKVPYTGGTANVVLTGTNQFQQAYNATTSDTTTVVNRQTLDSAIAGLGAGILNLDNTWGYANTNNLNGGIKTIRNAMQYNSSLDANSYFITGVSPTTYVFSTNWIINPVSGTTANIQLDPALFYFSTSIKYIITFTGIYGTGASWVGTVFNNSTSTTVSDSPIAITTTSQTLSMTFTPGSNNPTIYLSFVGASGTLRWTNFTIKEVDTEVMGNLIIDSQINSNIVQTNGNTSNMANGLKVNQTSIATASSLTTASLPAGVSASTLSGTYTLTATAGGTTFGMWLGSSFTYVAGAKYTYTFTGFSTNATASQAMILYTNTYSGGSGTSIGDYIVNVPITSSTISGSFTATSNNNVVWNFVSSVSGKSVSFTGFTLTRADTQITGITTLPTNAGTATSGLGLNASNQIITTGVSPNFSAVSVGSVPYESASNVFSNSLITQGTTDLGYTGASFTASTGIASITFSSPTYTANSNASVQGIITLPALPSIVIGLPCIATIAASTFPVFAVSPYPYFTLTNGATVVYTSPVGSPGTVSMPFTPTSTILFITLYFKAPPTGFTGGIFTWTNFTITTPSMTTTGFSNTTGRNTVGELVVSGATTLATTTNTGNLTVLGVTTTIGNRLLGTTDTSPTGSFWMGLNGSGSEVDRLAIALVGTQATGVVSQITLNKSTVATGTLTANGVLYKQSGTSGTYWNVNGGSAANAPYNEYILNGSRRCYIGNADTSNMYIASENGSGLSLQTNGTARININGTTGLISFPSVAQNTTTAPQVYTNSGGTLTTSQAVNKLVYFNNNVAWGGGVSMVNAFYLYNTACSVYIWGKNSGYYSGAGMMQTTIRCYSQSAGTYYYFPINAFVNNGNNHFTVPLDYSYVFPYTGYYDIYVYSTSGWITDTNDQLTIGVTILPASGF